MAITHNGRIYFTDEELRCKKSGILILAPDFDKRLLSLRLAFDKPMVVNSCCRSYEHNQEVGGNPRSLHVADKPFWPTKGCCAIDISAKDPTYRAELARIALHLGWWVGVNATFLHLDRRIDYGVANDIGMFLY